MLPRTEYRPTPTKSTAYLQEMAQLAKRAQTIIVHSHGQHGKDHHGNQYSPSVAQLQQRHDLANESYREVRSSSSSDAQQQDGKCVIPVFQLQPLIMLPNHNHPTNTHYQHNNNNNANTQTNTHTHTQANKRKHTQTQQIEETQTHTHTRTRVAQLYDRVGSHFLNLTKKKYITDYNKL